MKIQDVIKGIDVIKIINFRDVNITGIATHSKRINGENLFICLKGGKFDSHNEMEILQNKIDVFIVEQTNPNISKTQILVRNSHTLLNKILFNFNFLNKIKIKIIGITGTNGKTTTTYYLTHLLKNVGLKVARLGTNGCVINDKFYSTKLTTPMPEELVELIKIMIKEKVDFLVMEVSAHAILQKRIEGINFEIAAFTNLTQDHLDDFSSIYEYAYHKFSFIDKSKIKVVNIDDNFGDEYCKDKNIITYGKSENAIVKFVTNKCYLKITINNQDYRFKTNKLAEYNYYNLVLAITICLNLGIKINQIKDYLTNLPVVEGRYNLLNFGEKLVCVDYAHTPDAIEKILKELKSRKKDLIVVFGASGFRDSSKRVLMGKVASKYADFIILTADNPRYENISQINKQISDGISVPYVNIENRDEAIKYAFEISKKDSIIALLGKGNEEMQDICARDISHSDYLSCVKYGKNKGESGDKK